MIDILRFTSIFIKKTEPEREKSRIPGYLEACQKENRSFLWVDFVLSAASDLVLLTKPADWHSSPFESVHDVRFFPSQAQFPCGGFRSVVSEASPKNRVDE